MRPGQILVADHEGVYVIKMLGDVRLTLCISFDQFIDSMFSQEHFAEVLFDLSDAQAIDSTTLGLMAKIAILGRERHGITPVVLSTNPDIDTLLKTMGFHEIFQIVRHLETPVEPVEALPAQEVSEQQVKEKVIEAHRVLMDLNESNRQTFRNLVKMLEK